MKNNNSQITTNPIPNIPNPTICDPILSAAYNQFAEFCPDYEINVYSHESVTYTWLTIKYKDECGVQIYRRFCVASNHPDRLAFTTDCTHIFSNSETSEIIDMFYGARDCDFFGLVDRLISQSVKFEIYNTKNGYYATLARGTYRRLKSGRWFKFKAIKFEMYDGKPFYWAKLAQGCYHHLKSSK